MSGTFQTIVEHLSAPLVVVRVSAGSIRYANPAAEEAFGLAHGGLVDMPISDLFLDPRQFQQMMGDHARTGQTARRDALMRRADGTSIAMAIAMESLFYDDEAALVATFTDLTALRQMESELKVTAQVERLLSAVSTRFISLGPDEIVDGLEEALREIAQVILADSGFIALLENEHEGTVSDPTTAHRVVRWRSELIADPPPPLWEELLEEHLDWLLVELGDKAVLQLSSREPPAWLGARQGGVPSFSLVIFPIVYDQALRGIMGLSSSHAGKRWQRAEQTLKTVSRIFANVLQRRAAEQALAAEKELLSVTLGSIADGVIATDRQSRVMLMNRRAENLTGWTGRQATERPLPEVFRRVDDVTGEECANPVRQVLDQGLVVSNEVRLIAADGRAVPIAESAAPIRSPTSEIIGVVVAFGDISGKKQAEQEREKANKLEAVGLLAGGIAHDFRNILLIIQGNASLAQYCLDSQEEIEKILEQITSASQRAKELTEQLLTFSKGGAPVKARFAIHDLIHESVNFCFRGSKVVCEPEIAEGLWQIEADAGQLNQVLNNLLINADQAMSDGGRVRVVAENASVEETAEHGLEGDQYIVIRVTDEGPGISPEDVARIFDPYFTTKDDGTGLGLATAHSIVKHHEGHIVVDSELGQGTTFAIYLPAIPELTPSKTTSQEELIRGEGRVLVVDDEVPILELATGMLKKLGYDPVTVTDGTKAIETYAAAMKKGEPFDAVLMDLTIPGGMGGKRAVGKLREIDPEARVVVSSGYSQDPVMGDYEKHGFVDVLPKPFVITQLGRVLRHILVGED